MDSLHGLHGTGLSLQDVTLVPDVCASIAYYLTLHLSGVARGKQPEIPHEVGQILQLAKALPRPDPKAWALLAHPEHGFPGENPPPTKRGKKAAAGAAGAAAAPAAAAGAGAATPAPGGGDAAANGKRAYGHWTDDSKAELIKLVEDGEYRTELLGKSGTRAGQPNWSLLGRHLGFSTGITAKTKYAELSGNAPPEKKEPAAGKKGKAEGGGEEEKPAKKAKKGAAAEQPAAPTPAAAEAANGGDGEGEWSKQQGEELVAVVDDDRKRKEVLGKKKLKWKRVAEHFGKTRKECRRQYTKLTGNPAPEEVEGE